MLNDRRIRTSLLAIGADLILTSFKLVLAWATGSAALRADALHSGTDLIVSLVLLTSLMVRYREERANRRSWAHRLESGLAIIVALIILYVPWDIIANLDTQQAQTISRLWVGIPGVILVIVLVHFMARLKTHVGRETDSPALEADGYHSRIDLFTSVAVLLSLLGTLVGIFLDQWVAVAIAVLIAVAGIELLISGLASLMRGGELDQISLLDRLLAPLARIPWLRYGAQHLRRVAGFGWRHRFSCVVLLVVAWLSSAVQTVPVGYTGIEYRLGVARQAPLESGLLISLPWPLSRLELVPSARVYAASAGSDTEIKATDGGLWQELKANRAHDDETDYLATGDENLIDVQLTMHYRLQNPAVTHLQVTRWSEVVNRVLESSLWQETAHRSFDEILLTSHTQFSQAIARRAADELRRLGVPIEVVAVQIQSLKPPAMVVRAYRDLVNAEQEKLQRTNRALAQRTEDLLMANAQRLERQVAAEVSAAERHMVAEGEAERFNRMAVIFQRHAGAVRFERFWQLLVAHLPNRPLMIVDPGLEQTQVRLWHELGVLPEEVSP